MQDSDFILQAKSITCERGQQTLFSDISITLTAGDCLHIVGHNGSGKSSFLRILSGLLTANSGTIDWHFKASDDFIAPFVYLGHNNAIKNEFTASENLYFYQLINTTADPQAIDQSLAKVDMLNSAEKLAGRLSFGQQRKLAFARILLNQAQLWLLDEPFTGVDDNGRKLIEHRCQEHLSQGGAIILTHHHSLENSSLAPTELTIGAHH